MSLADAPAPGLPALPRCTIPIFLILATVLALWPVCTARFTSWDDAEAISENPTLLPPTLHSVATWWSEPVADLYIPITYCAWGLLALFALKRRSAGFVLNPAVFHTANLALHVMSTLVVYRLLRLLIRRRWPAAAGAAMFALHPVQVEAVAWTAGMKDLLYGLLALAAIWQYLLAVDPCRITGVGERGGKRHFAMATMAFGLALLSKPTAVVVPIMAAVLESLLPTSESPALADRRTRAKRLALWAAMALPIMFIAHRAQPIHRAGDYVPLWHRPVVALDAIAFYGGKLVWPAHLCIDYGRVPWKIFESGQADWTWIVPSILAAALLYGARRRPGLLAGPAVFCLGLLPVLGLVGFDFQGISTVADHYLYVPTFGVALLAAQLLAMPSVVRRGRVAAGAVAVVLAAWAGRSFAQSWSWHDSQTLFAHTLAVNPGSTAANESLSVAAYQRGDYRRAVVYALAGIDGNPRRPHGWVFLANAYTGALDPVRALGAMRRAYALEPDDPQVVNDLGVQLTNTGQFAAAADRFREALRLDPASSTAEMNLAIDLGELGDLPDGLAHLRRAAALAPTDPAIQITLGDFLLQMGQPAQARLAFETALRLRPGLVPALERLKRLTPGK